MSGCDGSSLGYPGSPRSIIHLHVQQKLMHVLRFSRGGIAYRVVELKANLLKDGSPVTVNTLMGRHNVSIANERLPSKRYIVRITGDKHRPTFNDTNTLVCRASSHAAPTSRTCPIGTSSGSHRSRHTSRAPAAGSSWGHRCSSRCGSARGSSRNASCTSTRGPTATFQPGFCMSLIGCCGGCGRSTTTSMGQYSDAATVCKRKPKNRSPTEGQAKPRPRGR